MQNNGQHKCKDLLAVFTSPGIMVYQELTQRRPNEHSHCSSNHGYTGGSGSLQIKVLLNAYRCRHKDTWHCYS